MIFDRTIVIGLVVIVVTGILLLVLRHPHVSTLFVQSIPDRPQRRLFLASVTFFLTFAGVRVIAYSNYHHIGP
jgi:TRAP-type C4-dicarboxylate transport system permease small subunit